MAQEAQKTQDTQDTELAKSILAIETALSELKTQCSLKQKEVADIKSKEDLKQKELDAISSQYWRKREELHKLERECRSKMCDLTYLQRVKSPSEDTTEISPDDIFHRCLRLEDITTVHPQDIDSLGEQRKSYSTMGWTEFGFTDEDMQKIKQILRISVEELETIVKTVRLPGKLDMHTLKKHTTGDVSYITYTGFGYVCRMIMVLHTTRCKRCQGITHKLHSCGKTFARYPSRHSRGSSHDSTRGSSRGTYRGSDRGSARGTYRGSARGTYRGSSYGQSHTPRHQSASQPTSQPTSQPASSSE
ncbi:MAG: hypothetical protein Homavirus1_3 [Homavirus sp.]|uniref:Uncharacterized protein n=1 Tax=Homavirus sp. TaxID=2487769 RepID=A0A3G5A820_9VIRU|nr:MAG: hypothetical protein Homavirus1_3 [Homavirus sp.]